MGFYGNIINKSKTELTFDKIYSNRAQMEENASSDGIFIGRYVLIEYDGQLTNYKKGFLKPRLADEEFDGIIYIDPTYQYPYKITEFDKNSGYGLNYHDIVYVDNKKESGTFLYYECINKDDDNNALFAFLEEGSSGEQSSKYTLNYAIDRKKYKEAIGRGWDSTVWQKIYDNGVEKYIMIAELNSVVPTFHLEGDAPTSTPIAPHFDVNSTNVLYTLHTQPQWGFRVKSSKIYDTPTYQANGDSAGGTTPSSTNSGGIFSNIGQIPSDQDVIWKKTSLDSAGELKNSYFLIKKDENGNVIKGEWQEIPSLETASKIPAAIYFNKKGFNPEIITYSAGFNPKDFSYGDAANDNNLNNTITDAISIEPTGYSGLVYQNHSNTGSNPEADIQELSVMLPSLGNAIASMWDIVYGNKELNSNLVETNENDQSLIFKRNLDISWEDAGSNLQRKGLRLFKQDKNGSPIFTGQQINTLAGCINTVHDMIGMNIVNIPFMPIAEDADENKIYFVSANGINDYKQGFYRKKPSYKWDLLNLDRYAKVDLLEWDPKINYYHKESNNYIKATTKYDTFSYYKFENEEQDIIPMQFSGEYEPKKYYISNIENEATVYVLCADEAPENGRQYYNIEPTYGDYLFYRPNTYYYQTSPKEFILDESPEMTKDRIYYTKTIKENTDESTDDPTIESGDIIFVYKQIDKLTDFKAEKYYSYQAPKYTEIISVPEGKTHCCTLKIDTNGTDFYQPNIYYYQPEGSSDYILSIEKFSEKKNYFLIKKSPVKITKKFYKKNLYYYESQGKYILDTNEIKSNRDYFKKLDIYVKEDTSGILPSGSIWKGNIDEKPDTVTLASRVDTYVMEELPDFGRTINTITGLILEINKILATNDEYTRDSSTIRGAINLINDIIANFAEMKKGEILIVDEYGRMHSAKVTDNNNPWIDININPDKDNPSVLVTHTLSSITPGSYGDISNQTPKFGETFKVPHFTADQAGHITQLDTHTIAIPKMSLTEKTTGNLLTDIDLDDINGILTLHKVNVGSLKLNGFQVGTSKEPINSNDTINSAFGKLQKNINIINGDSSTSGSIAKAVNDAINSLKGENIDQAFDTLVEIQNWIHDGNEGSAALVERVSALESKQSTITERIW